MALVVFSSCAKKEEAKEETAKMSITIINKTDETAKDITLKEQKASKPQSWGQGELANDQEITITINTVVENDAPFLYGFFGQADLGVFILSSCCSGVRNSAC